MFRLVVWHNRHWKWGIRDYDTLEAAIERVEQLKAVGIKAKVKPISELLN